MNKCSSGLPPFHMSNPRRIEGRTPEERGETTSTIVETISPNYFRLMNIGLRDGRELQDSDGLAAQPVAVISQNVAKRYFPGQSPLGKKLKIGKGLPLAAKVGRISSSF